jgi:hypothetical protein
VKVTDTSVGGYGDGVDDSEEVLECYRRIKDTLERLKVIFHLFLPSFSETIAAECERKKLEDRGGGGNGT